MTKTAKCICLFTQLNHVGIQDWLRKGKGSSIWCGLRPGISGPQVEFNFPFQKLLLKSLLYKIMNEIMIHALKVVLPNLEKKHSRLRKSPSGREIANIKTSSIFSKRKFRQDKTIYPWHANRWLDFMLAQRVNSCLAIRGSGVQIQSQISFPPSNRHTCKNKGFAGISV